MSTKLTLSVALSLSASALANTYVVDDTPGPGVDFATITAAVAFAQPGDVLIVRDGTYAGFVLDKRLIVVGTGNVLTTSGIEVRNIPAGPRAAIVHVQTPSVVVDVCTGPVLLQELGAPATGRITNSSDVRIARTWFSSTTQDSVDALQILNSRVEFVDGNVRGHNGRPSNAQFQYGHQAGAGVVLASARFVAAIADVRGGNGTDEQIANRICGAGGYGIFTDNTSTAIVLGPSTVAGGNGAVNWGNTDCFYDSCPGNSVLGQMPGSTFAYSDTTLPSLVCQYGHQCFTLPVTTLANVTAVQSSPADPTLGVSGAPSAGATITFTVRGEVGAQASLNLGRGLTVSPTSGVAMERLVAGGRIFNLGPIPASGVVTRNIPLPSTLPTGFVICAQAEVVGSAGVTRTNSTPVVVR